MSPVPRLLALRLSFLTRRLGLTLPLVNVRVTERLWAGVVA